MDSKCFVGYSSEIAKAKLELCEGVKKDSPGIEADIVRILKAPERRLESFASLHFPGGLDL